MSSSCWSRTAISSSIGQPLAKAAPASIRHGGAEGEKPVDEFEWGLRLDGPQAQGVCRLGFLTEEEQAKLTSVIETMTARGFPSGESACLTQNNVGADGG